MKIESKQITLEDLDEYSKVSIETISDVIPHPNADRLTIYKVEGMDYQFISNVPYKVGDKVVFFPIDSIFPPELIEFYELGTMLAGSGHNRVKTVRLRGEYSQGFIASEESLNQYLLKQDMENPVTLDYIRNLPFVEETQQLGQILKVLKYDPLRETHKGVKVLPEHLLPLPAGNGKYDIDNMQSNKGRVQEFINEQIPVLITEKLEGQNFSVTFFNGEVFVSQRRFGVKDEPGNTLWETARRLDLLSMVSNIAKLLDSQNVTIYGELIGPGVQGNYYNLKEREVKIFDIKIDGKWTSAIEMLSIVPEQLQVPIIAKNIQLDEWLDGKSPTEAAYGKSALNGKLREGIVVRPLHEEIYQVRGGRLYLKQRCPKYLDKTGN